MNQQFVEHALAAKLAEVFLFSARLYQSHHRGNILAVCWGLHIFVSALHSITIRFGGMDFDWAIASSCWATAVMTRP